MSPILYDNHLFCVTRLLAGIYVHDVEFAELFQTDPYLRHSSAKLPLLSDDSLWAAATVANWGQKITASLSGLNMPESQLHSPKETVDHPFPSNSTLWSNSFHTYLELEVLATSASHLKDKAHDSTEQKYLEDAMMSFYESHIRPDRRRTPDPYCFPVLWHSIYLSLYADINHLELAIGKEGPIEAQNHTASVRSWASSPNGQRCALHAALILRALENERIGTEPPIHIPRIIFRAALVWFCFTNFGSDVPDSPRLVEYLELEKIGVNCQSLLFEANGFKHFRPTTPESSTFCGLLDMLERVGHWRISQLFSSILKLLLSDAKDNERVAR